MNFLVIDLETTGLNPANSEIIEIGAVKVENGVLTGHFQMLVKPQQMPSPEISDLTGITPEMLIDAPPLSVALQALLDFASAIGFWVAHNKDFEASWSNSQTGWIPLILPKLRCHRSVTFAWAIYCRLCRLSTANCTAPWPTPKPPPACCYFCWSDCASCQTKSGRSLCSFALPAPPCL